MEREDSSVAAKEDVRNRITKYLERNFPQIAMHGGDFSIQSIDMDEGTVTLRLGGACSGCGISPMTIQALKARLPQNIPEIKKVNASTETESQPKSVFPETTESESDEDSSRFPAAPF